MHHNCGWRVGREREREREGNSPSHMRGYENGHHHPIGMKYVCVQFQLEQQEKEK